MSGSGHELLFVKGYRMLIGCLLALEPGAEQILGEEIFIAFLLSTQKQPQKLFYLYYNSYCKGSVPLQAAGEVAQKMVGKSE